MLDELDFCIVITTFNRPEKLYSLLNSIHNCKKNYKVKIFVFDDNSTIPYDTSKIDATFIKLYPNRGKFRFWEIIDKTFKVVKNVNSKYFIYLQDDLIITDNFLENVKTKYDDLNDDKKICLEFRTDKRVLGPNWTRIQPQIVGDYIKTQWTELDFICEKKFFDVLNYEILPIDLNRWEKNKNLSSGVGSQLSERLLNLKYNMYHLKKSLVIHDGLNSLMNKEEREINNLITNIS